jgi:tetratricopeptide (TPR) repeat protein
MPRPESGGGQKTEQGDRLDSWKEVAAYLNCGVRTVQRWERSEGLPIRRHLHKAQATVYAYTAEIDKWRERRSPEAPRSDYKVPTEKSALVGRGAELTRLHEHLRRALEGVPQIVFVSGEIGIGKTALVRSFLNEVASDVVVIQGKCVEQYGSGEPYLPVIEGVARLLRESASNAAATFARLAPTWVQQIPDYQPRRAVRREGELQTHAGMARQFDDALNAASRQSPVVLFLDDLHWSDWSTVELIDRIGRREDSSRLLLVGTYRLDDLLYRDHPLVTVEHELRIRGRCAQVRVPPLKTAAVSGYLSQYGNWKDLARAAGQIVQWTGGNPLFMSVMLDHLIELGALAPVDGVWDFGEDLQQTGPAIPKALRDVIHDRLRRLGGPERQALGAASVAGGQFSSRVVAAALDAGVGDVERVLQSLAERHQIIRPVEPDESSLVALDAQYAFAHALYQTVVYDSLAGQSRADHHRRIANWLERANERDYSSIAAELAMHYERAHDADRAAQYYEAAAVRALSRSAGHDALRCAHKSLAHLAQLPADAERDRRELRVRLSMCAAASSVSTMVDPAVVQAYRDALNLCERVGDDEQLIPALLGIERFHVVRGDILREPSPGDRALAIARTTKDPALLAGALQHRATVLLGRGRFLDAYACAADASVAMGERLADAAAVAATGFYPVVAALTVQSWAAWFLGKLNESVAVARAALDRAERLGHPQTRAFAQAWLAAPLELCGAAEGRAWAERALGDAAAFDLPMVAFFAEGGLGWILARHGDPSGVNMIRRALTFQRETGIRTWIPLMNGWLADSLIRVGQFEAALAAVQDGLTISEQTGVRFYDAELHGLRSDTLQHGAGRHADERAARIEQCDLALSQSLAIAREQGARTLQLRAMLRRLRLPNGSGAGRVIRDELAALSATFSGQLETPDLVDARRALE